MQNIPRYKPLISDHKKFSVDYQITKDCKQNLLVADSEKLEQILTLFYQMLKEFPMGIESGKIVPWITQSMEDHFDFRDYGCNSIYEFINKFIMPTTEITIINNKPDSFLIRSKQIYSNTQPSSGSGSYQRKSDSNDGQSLNHSNSQGSIGTTKSTNVKKQGKKGSSDPKGAEHKQKQVASEQYDEQNDSIYK